MARPSESEDYDASPLELEDDYFNIAGKSPSKSSGKANGKANRKAKGKAGEKANGKASENGKASGKGKRGSSLPTNAESPLAMSQSAESSLPSDGKGKKASRSHDTPSVYPATKPVW